LLGERLRACGGNHDQITSVHISSHIHVVEWLRHEFRLGKIGQALSEPHKLDVDAFVRAVCSEFPKGRKWSAAEIARLKQGYADTLIGVRNAAADILALERKLSDLVNAA
jgi:hypothetical protein